MANREDGCSGAFWAARFRSVAILDESSLLATAAYIDLNPVAAGVAPTPEDSTHTSFRARLDHCRNAGLVNSLRDDLSTQTEAPAQETAGWLLPTDDRRPEDGARPGLMPGLTLSCYCRLIDWTSRLAREGKAHVPESVASIFDRLHAAPDEWAAMVAPLLTGAKRTGSHFGGAARLTEAARTHGRRWHRNQLPRATRVRSTAA
jgi:hypothetical protein